MTMYRYDVRARTVFVSLRGRRLGEVSPSLSFDTPLRDYCVRLGNRCDAAWAEIQATANDAHTQGSRWCGPDNRLMRNVPAKHRV